MSRTSERGAHTAKLGRALLMDTASEPFFDRLLRFAGEQLHVPIAVLSIVSDDGDYLKSSIGLPEPIALQQGMPSPLAHAVVDFGAGDAAVVADAREPLIPGAQIGAFVALRLRGQHDEPIATFYVADRDRREWSAEELRQARAFAELLEEAVRARRSTLALGADQVRQRDAVARRHRAETDAHREQAQESAAVEQLSARLQRALLPARLDADLDGRVVLLYEPGSERLLLGGDFLDVRRLAGERIAFVLGDVCGHGPEAAALAVALRASWNALQDDDHPLETIADRLGHTVTREQPEQLLFATALLGVLDERTRVATLLSAGHPRPIAIGDRAEPIELPRGLPLGLAGDDPAPWTAATVQLGQCSLLTYTDGLTEGRIAAGASARLGEGGLVAAIEQALHAEAPPRALGRRLFEHATRAHGSPLPDDVALLQLFA
ncbi:PP2C family protein-serine/threonine phosphatase [Conexibacter stalactiti]|uniref:PP2C family protein-serine/threonine phosphatase n=1 Tax=Conexibacter stalactiti TaxID=1940611 RepID=A0ABU4HVN5_9ACTN|nr:PP2C family protein-serine/threonine phosphatase [Conexibacter stalactiti]MDW5597353.1 PP2C family protein-serine/threonine phosphatase [Conexibacter stalactiti]MEC5037995.1 PP2C family protein-serine/threonine phosphatase [Conexibacter stalactiti]